MWVVGQGEIKATAVVGVTMENDVGTIIGTVITARSQLLCIIVGRLLGLCEEIVEVRIPIQVLGTQEEKLNGVAPVGINQLT